MSANPLIQSAHFILTKCTSPPIKSALVEFVQTGTVQSGLYILSYVIFSRESQILIQSDESPLIKTLEFLDVF